MSRDYCIIKNGKFWGNSFNVNVTGTLLLGRVMARLGLPVDTGSPLLSIPPDELIDFVRCPHELVGEKAQRIRDAFNRPGFSVEVRKAIEEVEDRGRYSSGTVQEDTDWVIEFLWMAMNPEGFASDYCEQYYQPEQEEES